MTKTKNYNKGTYAEYLAAYSAAKDNLDISDEGIIAYNAQTGSPEPDKQRTLYPFQSTPTRHQEATGDLTSDEVVVWQYGFVENRNDELTDITTADAIEQGFLSDTP